VTKNRLRSDDDRILHILCPEELFTELRGDPGLVHFAAEDVDVGVIGLVGEMRRDTRCLDELCQRIPRHPVGRPEMNDLGFAEPFHLDEVADLDDKLVQTVPIPDDLRVASSQIDTGAQPPRADLGALVEDLLIRCILHHRCI